MECQWSASGVPVECQWSVSGVSVDTSLECHWSVIGVLAECPWLTSKFEKLETSVSEVLVECKCSVSIVLVED